MFCSVHPSSETGNRRVTLKHGGGRGVTVSVACWNGRVGCEGHAQRGRVSHRRRVLPPSEEGVGFGRELGRGRGSYLATGWWGLADYADFLTWINLRETVRLSAAIELFLRLFHNDVQNEPNLTLNLIRHVFTHTNLLNSFYSAAQNWNQFFS